MLCWLGVMVLALSSSAPVSEGLLELSACCIHCRGVAAVSSSGRHGSFSLQVPFRGNMGGSPSWVGSQAGVTCFAAALLWGSGCSNAYCSLSIFSGQSCCLLPG